MAKIWAIYGERQKDAARELPWPECVQRFGLAGVAATIRPRGDGKPTEHVTMLVIEPSQAEAHQHGIEVGCYVSPLPPGKIERLLAEVSGAEAGMSLSFSGRTTNTVEQSVSFDAHDSGTGQRVIVKASREAMDDHGELAVQQAATEKYAAGRFEADGKTIFVRTADCA